MNKPQIWIDADSCPSMVRNFVVKYSAKLQLKVYFVANKQINCAEKFPYEMIICSTEKDAADNYILEHCDTEDLVITRDIVFADKLVDKGITAINDRGTTFTKENIKPKLAERNFDFQLAQIGLVQHYNEGYDKKKFALFANCFDKTVHHLLK
ncbi:MAG: DUF188 domain-containing protein [Treponema sp.]|nr:DUF188 domain-containing protein [Treponema sp.]